MNGSFFNQTLIFNQIKGVKKIQSLILIFLSLIILVKEG